MDYDTYCLVMEHRGDLPMREVHGFPYALYAYRQDLIKGKIVWTNNKYKDLIRKINTDHSILSICAAPMHHPYSKSHRLLLLFSDLSLSFLSSVSITAMRINDLSTNLYLSIVSSLFITFFNTITKSCLVCSCCENRSPHIRRGCKYFGCAIALYLQFAISLTYLLTGFAILSSSNINLHHFWAVYAMSNSACFGFSELLIIYISFRIGWYKEHKYYEEGLLKAKTGYYVTFDECEHIMRGDYLSLSETSSPMPVSSTDYMTNNELPLKKRSSSTYYSIEKIDRL